MKRLSELTLFWQKCALLSVIFCLGMIMSPIELSAKMAVKKVGTASTVGMRDGRGGSKVSYHVACEGYKTWIKTDEKGRTQVYINDDGGDYSDDEKYRVELEELSTIIDWNIVDIYGGKEYGNCNEVNIKMDGGCVKSIYLGGYSHADDLGFVTGNAYLTVTAGTIYSVEALNAVKGSINIYLSNVKYTGNKKIIIPEEKANATTIFINNDCTFYAPSSRLISTNVTACKGAVIPNADDFMQMETYGAAIVPAGFNVECNTFTVNGTLTMDGTVNVLTCSGWKYEGVYPSAYPNLTVKAHQQVMYITKAPTCTGKRQWKSNCDVCGVQIMMMYDGKRDAPLGHNWVEDPAVEATCTSTGLTAGSHCSRCGLVQKAQEVVAMKSHTYGDAIQSTDFSACFGRTAIQIRKCTKCNHIKTTSTQDPIHDWVMVTSDTKAPSSGRPINSIEVKLLQKLNKEATCTREGSQSFFCKKCGFIKFETVEPTNHAVLNHIAAVPATCTESGYKEYWQCAEESCGQMFSANSNANQYKFYNHEDMLVEALGHKYGVKASFSTHGYIPGSYIKNVHTHVSDADCTHPAIYHESCSQCGLINNNLYFTSGEPIGHKYFIKSIDYINEVVPEQGMLTIGCEHCERNWDYFQFSVGGSSSEYNKDPNSGYAYTALPIEISKLPTCLPGEGKYEVTINYLGQEISKQYESFVRPNAVIHNYGADGICHEDHYKYFIKKEGDAPSKNEMGDLLFAEDTDGNLIPDNTVYSVKAYCAIAYKDNYKTESGGSRINPLTYYNGKEIDDDDLLAYTDWVVTNFDAIDENFYNTVKEALAAGKQVAIGIYEDTGMPVNTAFSTADPNLAFVTTAGHTFTTLFDDNVAYNRTTPLNAAELTYSRDCSASLAGKWQALMVPFSIEMTEEILSKCDVAQLSIISGDTNEGGQQANVAMLTKFTLGETTPASTPLFIRPKQAGKLSLVMNDVALDTKTDLHTVSMPTATESYELHGVYDGTFTVPADGSSYYAPYNGALTRFTGGLTHANRWYMKRENLLQGQSMAKSLVMHVFGEDNDNSINGIDVIEEVQSVAGETHSIDGRKLSDDKELIPGFYIKDHKKVLVK